MCGLIGHTGGAQSDLILVRQSRAAHVPSGTPLTEAGGLPLAGLTALQGLYRPGALPGRNDPRVLVLGASGGVGAFAVQLAHHAGASVTAVTTARTADFVAGLGSDEVLDRDAQDPLRLGQRWDVIFDTPGRTHAAHASAALRPGGIFITTCGISADEFPSRLPRHRAIRFAAVRTTARSIDLSHLLRPVNDHAIRVPIEHSYPVADIVDAHRAADHGTPGKIGVTLDS